jgi:hypothetical protein
MKGVPGSSPGVGSRPFAGQNRLPRCLYGPDFLEHIPANACSSASRRRRAFCRHLSASAPKRLLGLGEGLFRQPGKVHHSSSPLLAVRTKVGQAFPEATLSVRRREALAEAIDLVHDRYGRYLGPLGARGCEPRRPVDDGLSKSTTGTMSLKAHEDLRAFAGPPEHQTYDP